MSKKIGRGTVAKNSAGLIGYITSDAPELVTLPDGNKNIAWVGVQLQSRQGVTLPNGEVVDVKAGAIWTARNPQPMDDETDAIASWS